MFSKTLIRTLTVVLATLIVCAAPAFAATYYVKPATSGGSDANDGTSLNTAWATINRGDFNQSTSQPGPLQPGDVVEVQPGDYNYADMMGVYPIGDGEGDLRYRSGEPGNPIKYVANNAAGAVRLIVYSAQASGWAHAFKIAGVHDIVIDGFEIVGSDWSDYREPGIKIESGDNIEIKNCYIHDLYSNTYTNYIDMTNDTSTGVFNNVFIHHNIFAYTRGGTSSSTYIGTYGGYNGAQSGLRILNNVMTGPRTGIYLYNTDPGVEIRNNIIANGTYAILNDGWGSSLTPITNSHNLYWNITPDYYASVPDVATEIIADPRFIGGDPFDYHLQASSPAINAGMIIEGFPYNGASADIGVYETDYQTATISGDVTTPAGAGLGYTTVEAVGTSYSTTADADGHYALAGLTAGTYTLKATFGRVSETAAPVTVDPGDSITQDLTLTPQVKTFYVKTGGNNSADGESIGTAWATIANGDAKGLIKPGDTVQVQAGTYPANISLATGSGAAGYPVTYVANGAAIISPASGTAVTLGATLHDVVFDGMEITGAGLSTGIYFNGADGITVQNCRVHSLYPGAAYYFDLTISGSNGIHIWKNLIAQTGSGPNGYGVVTYGGIADLRIQNNTIDKLTTGLYAYGNPDPIIVTNNILSNCTYAITDDFGGTVITNAYNLYWNNGADYRYDSPTRGPGERTGDPMYVGGSPFSYQLQSGSAAVDAGTNIGFTYSGVAPDLGAYESSFTRTGVIYHVKPAAEGGDDNADGLSLATAWATIGNGDAKSKLLPLDTVLVEAGEYSENVVLSNSNGSAGAPITYRANGIVKITASANAVLLSAASHDLVIDGFEFTGSGMYSGVNFAGADNITVRNCWFHDMAPGYSYHANVTTAGSRGIHIYKNVFSMSGARDNFAVVTYGDTGDFRIQNNTFDNVKTGIYIYAQTETTPVTNNIFVNCDVGLKRDDTSSPVVNTYNLYYNNGTDYMMYVTPAAKGLGEFNANPNFVGGSPFNYHLNASSPAVDAGTDIGLGFLGDGPEIGAFEVDPAVTPYAKITGTVTNSATGLVMPGVTVEDLTTGASTVTSSAGIYMMFTETGGTHTIKCTFGSLTSQSNAPITLGITNTVNFSFNIPNHTYRVKNGGNDNSDGLTLATAWATIGNGDAKQKLVASDTVLVEPGTYTQANLTKCAGAADHPITYKANGAGVIISEGSNPPINISGTAHYNVIDGFEITGTASTGVKVASGVDNLTIQNCWIHDLGSVFVDLTAGNNDGVFVRKNLFSRDATTAGGYAVVTYGGTDNFEVENNTFDRLITGVYIYAQTDTTYVTNNIFTNCREGLRRDDGSSPVENTYNLYFGNEMDYVANYAAAPKNTGEFNADPLFVGGSPYNYHLQDESPAINAGIDIGLDFNGSAPDLGAFESDVVGGTEYTKLSDVKGLPVLSVVIVTQNMTVTVGSSTFADGSYYIEEATRFAGMKVKPEVAGLPSVVPGDQITFRGTVREDANGEKYIGLQQVTKSSGSEAGSLGMGARALLPSSLPNAEGLLAKTWGLVTVVTADYIYVDDGSGVNDGTGNGNGVRVMLSGLNSPITKTFTAGSTYAQVTGVVSLDAGGVRCVRPRGDADVTL